MNDAAMMAQQPAYRSVWTYDSIFEKNRLVVLQCTLSKVLYAHAIVRVNSIVVRRPGNRPFSLFKTKQLECLGIPKNLIPENVPLPDPDFRNINGKAQAKFVFLIAQPGMLLLCDVAACTSIALKPIRGIKYRNSTCANPCHVAGLVHVLVFEILKWFLSG